jgi:hypothetical protein
VDNDCDGLADEALTPGADGGTTETPSADTGDMDGDGQSIAQGDCDDRPGMGAMAKKNGTEVCGDGLDNDCSGAADDGCNPYGETTFDTIAVDPLSLEMGQPVIRFDNGFIASGLFEAGPSIFSVNLPLVQDVPVEFRITAAHVKGAVELRGGQVFMHDAQLGGVLDARTLGNIKGFEQSAIGLGKEDSLLDLTFAGFLFETKVLELPKDPMGHQQPDIDVDGDGLESFWDSNPDDDIKRVDRCRDGDGTIIESMPDAPCWLAMRNGMPRFVDGISIALQFNAVPARLGPVDR